MNDKERLQLEQECLLKYSKAQMIEKYIDEFEENIKLSELWCKSQEENKQLKRDKKIMQNYLQLIADIGYDYDGYNDIENLKALIDELCKYALCGIKLDDKKIISSSCEKYYNILGEEILGDKE